MAIRTLYNTKPKIILEGHFMTYKTSVATYWNRTHDVTLISGDWKTSHGCPIWGHPTYPPRRVIRKAYDSIIDFMELFPEQTFIIDRFHVSQQYYDEVLGTHYYKNIEKRLEKMNAIIVYLRNRFDNFEEALKKRMGNYHSQMVEYPRTIEEYNEQEHLFREILHRTSLPLIEYDVTGKNVNVIASNLEQKVNNFL